MLNWEISVPHKGQNVTPKSKMSNQKLEKSPFMSKRKDLSLNTDLCNEILNMPS
jgi:hypothetical protein